MPQLLVTVSTPLHAAMKAARQRGDFVRFTLSELAEVGALLMLVETGAITSSEDAERLDPSGRALAVFKRIEKGEPW